MAVEDRRKAWFNFGRVFSRGFSSFGQALAPALLITLIFIVVPQAVLLWFVGTMSTSEDFQRLMNSGMMVAAGIGGVVMWIFAVAAQTGLVHLAMCAQQRKPVSFGESMLTGLRLFLPMLGLNILVSLGTGLGLLLLIVPGLILAVMWSVAVPARLHDGPGVTAAMEESANLTKGVRWMVFAVLLVGVIMVWVVQLIGAIPGAWMGVGDASRIGVAILQPLTTGAVTLITTFGTASLFHELKWGDRDASEQTTAELFE